MAPSVVEAPVQESIHIAKSLKVPVVSGHALPDQNQLDASKLNITLSENPRAVPSGATVWGEETICTDHMVTARWTTSKGWQEPDLKPYGPLSIMPTSNVLHYATSCFEGLKLYRGYDGRLRLFQPWRNTARMLLSSKRIALPGFDPDELLKLIVKLCAVDGPKWLPKEQAGHFLYIRPIMIGDHPSMGVQKPKSALLYVVLSIFPALDIATKGLHLMASEEESSGVRAWPGGHGWAKLGANYGPSLMSQAVAQENGCEQVLWLLKRKEGVFEVTEAGASNFFVAWRTREGDIEIVTAPLGDRIILDGVTRRSILHLARERLHKDSTWPGTQSIEKVTVQERPIEIQELVEAVAEGRMIEAFAAGTAFFVAPVSLIKYYGRDLKINMAEEGTGTYARVLKDWLKDIMYGREKNDWMLEVEEEEN